MKKLLLLCGIINLCLADYSFGGKGPWETIVPDLSTAISEGRDVTIRDGGYQVQFLIYPSQEAIPLRVFFGSDDFMCEGFINCETGIISLRGDVSKWLITLAKEVAKVLNQVDASFVINTVVISNKILGELKGVNAWEYDCEYFPSMIQVFPKSKEKINVMFADQMFNERCFIRDMPVDSIQIGRDVAPSELFNSYAALENIEISNVGYLNKLESFSYICPVTIFETSSDI